MSKIYKHQNVIELTIANLDDTLTMFIKYFKQIAKKKVGNDITIVASIDSRLGTVINVF